MIHGTDSSTSTPLSVPLSVPPLRASGQRTRRLKSIGQLVEVSMSGDLPFSFSAFPNPCVTDDLNISYYAQEAGLVTLSLLTVEGRELSSITREALPGTNALRMSMNDIPAGLYLLEVTQAGQQLLQRVTRL